MASEDATVVVGAVIDPEMQNELRVTIVTTGIGQAARPAAETATPPSVKLVQKAGPSISNADYVRPEQRVVGGRQKGPGEVNERAEGDLDYLDILAFLRRQAD